LDAVVLEGKPSYPLGPPIGVVRVETSMVERLIEICVPAPNRDLVERILKAQGAQRRWTTSGKDCVSIHVLAETGEVEGILDPLEARCSKIDGFYAVVLSTEASLPRLPEAEAAADKLSRDEAEGKPKKRTPMRVSREELRRDIEKGARLDRVFLVMVALSSVVASIGLARDSSAIVIGAMVIAPLLGPNMALALATTLGDRDLGRRALKTGGTGLALAFALAMAMGLIWSLDPTNAEIASRTQLSLSDIVLALASGAAGALAFTSGAASSLVGVMVAVALLPPMAVFAMLLVGGHPDEAWRALLLLSVNLICVNLAGVVTFLLQGIGPRTWWEAEKTRRATRRALVIWCVLLFVGAGLILLSQQL
jgi:uncharacterized hydrophobic protein (TIGR00341 family)